MPIPISAPKNSFFDGEQVTTDDLILEQNYNTQIQASIIDGHFGSGVVPSSLIALTLFDSNVLGGGSLDGTILTPQAQPSDPNNGVQLSVQLSGSLAAGNRTIKVLIIGLDLENNLQYDALTFHTNEIQITQKHYTYIITVMLNDLVGSSTQSLNLGGRVLIQEAKPFTLSRNTLMVAQNTQPNLFFRDFFVASGGTISNLLVNALPNYSINNLGIQIGYLQLRSILENDVSTQIGQKFIATSNNIQKINLLLSVANSSNPNNLLWTGKLQVNVYQLQSVVSNPLELVPQLAIDFDPINVPLAQLSFDYGQLQNNGVVLNGTPQPVSFVFSNTSIGTGNIIKPGNYYAVTVQRAGQADTCEIQVAVGSNIVTNTRETIFNGSTWTDVPGEAIWFEVFTDAAKVSDGQAYDVGQGMIIPKNQINPLTGVAQDFSLNQIPFVRNDLYYALAQATNQQFMPVQDPRTGNNVFSQQQINTSISLLNANGLASIKNTSEPFIIGTISDQNVKTYNVANATINGNFHTYGFIHNQIVIKVTVDPGDGYSITHLKTALEEGSLNGAKIVPDTSNPSIAYRIAKAELLTMIYGDVNGDGVVDINDLIGATNLVGYNLNVAPTYNQYISLTTFFMNDINLHWQIVNPNTSVVIASGTNGILTSNPTNGTSANFHSASFDFTTISNLNTYVIVVSNSVVSAGNNGTYTITSLISSNDITIQKQYYTSDVLMQVIRANVSNTMLVSATDVSTITNYVNAVQPFPATTTPGNRVGTTFEVIKLTLEEFVDRADDYPSSILNRSSIVHPLPDIFLDGYGVIASTNVSTTPIPFTITQQLVWYASNVLCNSNPRMVEASFNYQSGYNVNPSSITGVVSNTFPQPPSFDPGRNDIFIPNNLIMNFGGQLTTPDGYYHKIDFEVSTFVIEIPPLNFNGEQSVNIFNDLVANFTGTGYTRLGYTAMRFADQSFVGMNGLQKNQVRFGVAVQSFSPQINGIDPSNLLGVVIDDRIGVSLNYLTGILTLQFNNTYQDMVQQTLNTKVQITVYLKKSGWNNNSTFFMSSNTTEHWLGLV